MSIFKDNSGSVPRACLSLYGAHGAYFLFGAGYEYYLLTILTMSTLSASTLIVPSTRRSTLGDRAFPVAAARAWNAVPGSIY